jgi:hypothetical protein
MRSKQYLNNAGEILRCALNLEFGQNEAQVD